LLSYQMMRSKLIGSKEAIENFQFVTINGRVEFEDVGKVARIAYYYPKAVKAGINLALRGVFTRGVTFPYFLLLLIPPRVKGSYTFTLNSLGLVGGNTNPPIHFYHSPNLVSSARHQLGDHQ